MNTQVKAYIYGWNFHSVPLERVTRLGLQVVRFQKPSDILPKPVPEGSVRFDPFKINGLYMFIRILSIGNTLLKHAMQRFGRALAPKPSPEAPEAQN